MRKVANYSDAVRGYAALLTLASLLSSLLVLPSDRAVATNWNVASGSWFDAGNWTAGVPTGSKTAYLNNGGTSQILLPGALAQQAYVGNTSLGELEVSSGGSLATAFGAYIGFNSAADGTATVTGPGSTWSVTNSVMDIGFRGSGELTISDAGNVASFFSQIAVHSGSDGTVTVTGADSTWTNSGLSIGASGTGLLNIFDGGLVDVAQDTVVGREVPDGSIHFDGGTLSTGGLIAGRDQLVGTGIVNTHALVTDIDLVFDQNSGLIQQIHLSSEPDQNITINLQVNGSGSMGAGYSGLGSLSIGDGHSIQSVVGYIGYHGSSQGVASVIGAGSNWTMNLLYVGHSGSGNLSISDGASVITNNLGDFSAIMGAKVGSEGKAIISGEGTNWSINGGSFTSEVIIGEYGSGELVIENGAQVIGSKVYAIIGAESGSNGIATVSGHGSTWLFPTTGLKGFTVGEYGMGILTIEDGGQVFVGDCIVGRQFGSSGKIEITDLASRLNISGKLTVGGSAVNGGSGEVSLRPGASAESAQISIRSQGILDLEGGSLSTNLLIFEGTGGQFNWTFGTLHVGSYNGNLSNPGGTLAPGESAGSTMINGTYTQGTDATLEIEFAGLTPGSLHDVVNVTGTTSLDGQLQLALLDNYIPHATDTFTILDSTGALTGAFENVANAGRLDTTDGRGSFLVHYGSSSAFDANQIVLSEFALTGDYNGDGIVNAADFALWRDTDGSPAGYDVWQSHFGLAEGHSGGQSLNAAVPEPAAWQLALGVVFAAVICARRVGQAVPDNAH